MTDCFPLWQIPPRIFQAAQNSIHTVYRGQLYFCFGLEAKMCEENKTTRSHEIAVIAASYSTFSSALKQMKEVKDQWGAFYQVLLPMY